MLTSAEHEILNAHKSGSDKAIMLLFLLINVKMPTIVGILTYTSRKKSCSAELSKKSFYNIGPGCLQVHMTALTPNILGSTIAMRPVAPMLPGNYTKISSSSLKLFPRAP